MEPSITSPISGHVDRIMAILTESKDSPLATFSSLPVPTNDAEYMHLWFSYFKIYYTNSEKMTKFLDLIDLTADNFELHHNLDVKIKEFVIGNLKKKLKEISFQPRLETYLERFDETELIYNSDENEKDLIRRIILAYIYNVIQNSSYSNSLIDLKEYNIPINYIISLNNDHELFRDRILEFDSSSIGMDKSFYEKDIIFKPAIYSVFAGMKIHEDEMVGILDTPLLDLFDLRDEKFKLYKEHEKDMESETETETETITEKHGYDDDADEHTEILDLEDLLMDDEDKELFQNFKSTSIFKQMMDHSALEKEADNAIAEENVVEEGELSPYTNDLDYLYDQYRRITLLSDLKEMTSKEPFYGEEKETKQKIFKLKNSLMNQGNICSIRLKISLDNNFVPRLEKIVRKLKLSVFEKDVLITLCVKKIFIENQEFRSRSESLTIGDLLLLITDDSVKRVNNKKYFLKTAKLVRSNLIRIDGSYSDPLVKNLYEYDIEVDNRLIEYLVGENFDISDYVDGGYLYHSNINLDSVILPAEIKNDLLDTISNFPLFLQAKKNLKFSEVIEYGNAMVMLFVGPSGSGKTMLANAVSNYLGKKILLFNLNNIANMSSSEDSLFPILFREARINDAVLFFDESETLLQKRFHDLLIEIEKHEGIVIFATNATFSINEAMRRRVNMIVEFENPGPALRKEIWTSHFPQELSLADDVDLDLLAERYEINGGLIKNAVFAALAKAVNDSRSDYPQLNMSHLVYGAQKQLQNKLFMSQLKEKKIPVKGFEALVLPERTMDLLNEVVHIEKAKKVLDGEWGFKEAFPDDKGLAVLFHGPSGTGKTYAAEAIAYETGKTLKIVNYSQVTSMWVGQAEKNLESLFKEVADNDSILLFDEADALFTSRGAVTSSTDKYSNLETDVLLSLLERYNIFSILTTNFIDNVDKAFYRRIRYLVEFTEPEEEMRYRLWQTLMPPKLPIAADVDLAKLAGDFKFTGGDIKNAIIKAATKRAISLDKHREVLMADFMTACEDLWSLKKRHEDRKIGF